MASAGPLGPSVTDLLCSYATTVVPITPKNILNIKYRSNLTYKRKEIKKNMAKT